MIANKILSYLADNKKSVDEALLSHVAEAVKLAFKRRFFEEDVFDSKGKLWGSSCGKCVRQNAYNYLGVPKNGRGFDSRAKLVFWAGDIAELTITILAKAAGVPITNIGSDQLKASLQVGDKAIALRPDGLCEGHLVEIKSMTSYSFERFEKSGPGEEYYAQVQAGMEALNLEKCVFVAYNKESSVLAERIVHKDPEYIKTIRANAERVFASTLETLPERPMKPDDKGFYPWNCIYCDHHKTCLVEPGLAELVVVKNAYKMRALNDNQTD
jgi:hypothetical protein